MHFPGVGSEAIVEEIGVRRRIHHTIRELRRSQGLSISELARRSRGLSKGLLSNLEREKFSPSVCTLIKISDGLNIELRKLLTLTSVELLLADSFVRQVQPLIKNLSTAQRERVLKTLAAAPKREV